MSVIKAELDEGLSVRRFSAPKASELLESLVLLEGFAPIAPSTAEAPAFAGASASAGDLSAEHRGAY